MEHHVDTVGASAPLQPAASEQPAGQTATPPATTQATTQRPTTTQQQAQAIATYIAQGIEHGCGDCIGMELEHFIVRATDKALVPYHRDPTTDAPGVRDVLERLVPFYDEQIYETQPDGRKDLIGLNRSYASITLEPGAQIEISISPVLEIRDIQIVYHAFRSDIDPILAEFGYELLTSGYHPTSRARNIPLIPKARYHFMDEYFKSTGAHGICMMRATASTQISIDYSSATDAIRKFRIANLLSPLLAFITDNSPVFESTHIASQKADKMRMGTGALSLPIPQCMVRTAIWDDVDPARSLTAPGTFDEGFSFESYGAAILRAPAIFTVEDNEAGGRANVAQCGRSFAEVFAGHSLSRANIEHILSLFFFDVRFKTYVEIRIADSLPLPYALSFAALIKGIFYSPEALTSLDALVTRFGHDGAAAISDAKAALRQQGFAAHIYGQTAAEWLDELLKMAETSLGENDRHFLAPLAHLITSRTTLATLAASPASLSATNAPASATDPAFVPAEAGSPAAALTLSQLQETYRAYFEREDGDVPGRLATQNYLDHSTAIYHGEVIGLGFLPKLYNDKALRTLDALATTTYGILEKVTRRFLSDAAYRTLFGFSPLLEQLICLPAGYEPNIPIMRVDLFLDEETLGFHFCEFNTDGTSAMNEDREGTNALTCSTTFAQANKAFGDRLSPQELFEGWADEFEALYRTSTYAAAHRDRTPTIAIVDYLSSATLYEFEEFRSRFEARGFACLICDVASLRYREGVLYASDIAPSRFGSEEPQRVDAVYRRAVTGEILAELEERGVGLGDGVGVGSNGGLDSNAGLDSGDNRDATGALALIRAVSEQNVCMIGGFFTHVAHCKQLFAVLHQPETAAFLTDEERQFIRRHVPYTTRLDNRHIDLDAVKADKDHWIIKPEDGYGSRGVFAGIDKSQDEWEDLIDDCSLQPYIVQTFCKQYATPNTRLIPRDAAGERLFDSLEGFRALTPPLDAAALEPWNNLTGLYLYGGRFSGIFVRAGQQGIIAGFAGGVTVPVFLVDYEPSAGLALRVRPTPTEPFSQ
jgi:glutamate--cysteine ligase